MLTKEQIEEISHDKKYKGYFLSEDTDNLIETALELYAKLEKAEQWINDLHSGMYINCVYCGHRYGPKENTPVAMADILKEHIEQCPEHPLSKERELRHIAIDYYEKRIKGIAARNNRDFAIEALETLQKTTGSYNAENPWLGVAASVAILMNSLEKAEAELERWKHGLNLMADSDEKESEERVRWQERAEKAEAELAEKKLLD